MSQIDRLNERIGVQRARISLIEADPELSKCSKQLILKARHEMLESDEFQLSALHIIEQEAPQTFGKLLQSLEDLHR